ncbi:hypothetical protein DRQ33_01100 [bacterium]|nr:MAG: hypothetical protein DRQ33_01100 [bacterium]
MTVEIAIIRYGDPIAECDEKKYRFDSVYGYTEQYEFAAGKRKTLMIGKRDRLARKKTENRIYKVFPISVSGWSVKRWSLRIIYELYEFLLLIRYRPKIIAVVGAPVDAIIPYLFAKLFRKKMVLVFHSEIYHNRNIISKFIQKFTIQIVRDKKYVRTMCNGPLPYTQLVDSGINPDDIEIHSLYYPPEFFQVQKIEPIFSEPEKFNILFVGRFDKSKGVLDIIEVARKVVPKTDGNAHFFLIGDGKLRDTILRKIDEFDLNNNVKILGMRQNNTIYSYMSSSDVVLVPSYYECFGKTLAEAMISGTPAIAYNTGGLKFQIEDGVDGFLIPTGDIDSMAERIIRLYRNPTLRERIGKQAAKKRELYNHKENTLGAKLKAIFEQNPDIFG